jgi:hypothetical protein
MENNNPKKKSSTGRMLVALALVLIGLSSGTYAFVDFSQHKLDALSGDGSTDNNFNIKLVNEFDPSSVEGWNFKTKSSVSNKVSIKAQVPIQNRQLCELALWSIWTLDKLSLICIRLSVWQRSYLTASSMRFLLLRTRDSRHCC